MLVPILVLFAAFWAHFEIFFQEIGHGREMLSLHHFREMVMRLMHFHFFCLFAQESLHVSLAQPRHRRCKINVIHSLAI